MRIVAATGVQILHVPSMLGVRLPWLVGLTLAEPATHGRTWRQYWAMKLYADTPARRHRQILADVGFVVWAVIWLLLATKLYDLILTLGTPGVAIESAGSSIRDNMVGAGDAVNSVPVVGGTARTPFDRMSEAGQAIADAGRGQQEAVTKLAWFAAFCVAAAPIATLALIWLPLRIRFIRRAGATQRFIDGAPDLELFAIRALARQPVRELAAIDPDPVARWREGDPEVIRSLAGLELRDEGLHLP